jgi:pentatricopeptide repeat protein
LCDFRVREVDHAKLVFGRMRENVLRPH